MTHKERIKAALAEQRKQWAKKQREKRKKAQKKMLPFIPALASSVENGKTTMSFRYTPYPFYPRVGESFVAHCNSSPLQGLYKCIGRKVSSIGEVKKKYWKKIGVPSPEDYEDIMREVLSSETLNYEKKGYLYEFKRIQ